MRIQKKLFFNRAEKKIMRHKAIEWGHAQKSEIFWNKIFFCTPHSVWEREKKWGNLGAKNCFKAVCVRETSFCSSSNHRSYWNLQKKKLKLPKLIFAFLSTACVCACERKRQRWWWWLFIVFVIIFFFIFRETRLTLACYWVWNCVNIMATAIYTFFCAWDSRLA